MSVEPSFMIPDPPANSPLEPPSWTEYLQDYGIDSSSRQSEQNIDYYNDIATTVGLDEPSFMIPDQPPSWAEYLQDYGTDSAPDSSSLQSERNIDYYNDIATTVGPSSSDYDDYYTSATDSTLANNETWTTWMTTTIATNDTKVLVPVVHHTVREMEEKILIPEGVVVFVVMLFFVAIALIKFKCKKDALLKFKQQRDAMAMNTDDLAFYHQVDKMPKRKDSLTDVCDTQLPNKMPPVGLQDIASKCTSLVPALTNFNIIPGRIEIVRVQLRSRPSTLPHYIRPSYSSPDTFNDNRPIETLGRCPRTTASSPAIMTGLWQHYRDELQVHEGPFTDLCPIHGADIHSTMSNTSVSEGRVTPPPAYRLESEGFDMRPQSSGSTIPRKITCRFCRERSLRISPWSTPGASPVPIRKVVNTPPMTRSHSPVSVLESGLVAIAEEAGSIPSHALCSLGPVKIEHLEHITIVETDKETANYLPTQSEHTSSYHQPKEISKPTGGGKSARRPSCGPEIKLGVFKSLLAPSSSGGSKSGGSLTAASISSSNFAARMKEDAVQLKSSASLDQRRSSASLHKKSSTKRSSVSLCAGSSTKQSSSSHRFGIGKSKSDHFTLTSSRHHVDRVSGGHLDKSSSDGRYDSLANRSNHAVAAKYSSNVQPNDQVNESQGTKSESSGQSSEDDTSSQDSGENEPHSPSSNHICQVHSICQSIVSQVASSDSSSVEPICSEQQLGHVSSDNLAKSPRKRSSSDQSTSRTSIGKSSSLKLADNEHSATSTGVNSAKSSLLKLANDSSVHSTANLAKSSSVKFAESTHSATNNSRDSLVESGSTKLAQSDVSPTSSSSDKLAKSSSMKLAQSDHSSAGNSSINLANSPAQSSSGNLAKSNSLKLACSDHSCTQSSTCCCNLTKSSQKKLVDSDYVIGASRSNHSNNDSNSGLQLASSSIEPISEELSLGINSSGTLTTVTPMTIDDSTHNIGQIDSYILSSESSTTKSGSGEQVISDQTLYKSHAVNKGGSGKIIKSISKLFSSSGSSDSDQLIWQRKSNHSATSGQEISGSLSKRFSITTQSQSHQGGNRLIASRSRKLILSDLVLDEIGSPRSFSEHATTRQQPLEHIRFRHQIPLAPADLRSPPELPMVDIDLGERPEVDGQDEIPEHLTLTSYYGEDTESESSSEDELEWIQKF